MPPEQPWHLPSGTPPPAVPGYQQPPAYPPPVAYVYAPVSRVPALPTEPVEYQHVLHGARRAWWRPIASFGLVLVGAVAAFIGLLIVLGIGYAVLAGGDLDAIDAMADDANNPLTFTAQNLVLASLIPTAMLATWIAHGVRPGFVSSVLGRFRWGWFAWSLLVTVPVWLVYIGLSFLLGGGDDSGEPATRPSSWVTLLILTLLTTPLQAAGEEYLFRGWVLQQIGAWIKNTYVTLAIAIVISAVVFSLGHTSLDPWVLLDLGAFAAATVVITWRTGGLEAAIAMHVVNNLIVLIIAVLTTGFDDTFITPETTSDPLTTITSAVTFTITTAAIWWLAGKRGVARRTIGAPAADTAGGTSR